MSREIKFRGLRTDGKGWVYGCLINNAFFNSKTKHSIPYIFNPEECDNDYGWEYFDDDYGYYEVMPETVGQFTGLTDKNGKEIYEGDVLKIQTYNMTVKFTEGCFYAINENNSVRVTFSSSVVKIIGNIHEKGGKNEKH